MSWLAMTVLDHKYEQIADGNLYTDGLLQLNTASMLQKTLTYRENEKKKT